MILPDTTCDTPIKRCVTEHPFFTVNWEVYSSSAAVPTRKRAIMAWGRGGGGGGGGRFDYSATSTSIALTLAKTIGMERRTVHLKLGWGLQHCLKAMTLHLN